MLRLAVEVLVAQGISSWGNAGALYDRMQDRRIHDVATRVHRFETAQRHGAAMQSSEGVLDEGRREDQEAVFLHGHSADNTGWIRCLLLHVTSALAGAGIAGGASCLCMGRWVTVQQHRFPVSGDTPNGPHHADTREEETSRQAMRQSEQAREDGPDSDGRGSSAMLVRAVRGPKACAGMAAMAWTLPRVPVA